jgi:alpha-tubulin suppressor-like RCC1 family protein
VSFIRASATVATVALAAALLSLPGASAATGSSVFTWGSNDFGQLGDGSSTSAVRGLPGQVSVGGIVDISGGREHVVALQSNGTVVSWGSDAFGQLGNNANLSNSSTPVSVAGLSSVIDVDDGHYHSLALKADGTVWGWGQNSLGQLAQGNDLAREPVPVQWGSIDNAVGVYGGRDMTYVLDANKVLWCSGGLGLECGRAAGSEIRTPVTVPGLPDLVDVAGGRNHGVALATDGTVWTWGSNSYGQLGSGNFIDRPTPQQVPGLSKIVDIGAGAEHSMAVTDTGQVYVWGAGSRGELGLGTQTNRSSPTLVTTLSGIVEVNAGRSHSFAIGGDGRLWAWGWNQGHQVSTSGAAEVLSPVQVPGLTDIVAAEGGQAYSVALTAPVEALLSDGFDAGLASWTVKGKLRLDTSRSSPVGSTPSARASGTNRKAGAWRSLLAEQSAACLSAWVRPASVGKKTTLLRLRDATGAGVAQLQISPRGALRVRSDVDGVSSGMGVTLPWGQWRRLDLCTRHGQGAVDQVSVLVGGLSAGQWAWTTAPVSEIQIGSVRRTTATVNIDDVLVTGVVP